MACRLGLVTGAAPVTRESRSGIGHSHYFGCDRQSETERCTPSIVRRGPQMASVRLDNGEADRQTHTRPLSFGGKEGLEYLVGLPVIDVT